MILGAFYLTMMREGGLGEGRIFRNFDEALMAYENKQLALHVPIKVRAQREIDGVLETKLIDCTLGRYIFNNQIPQDLG